METRTRARPRNVIGPLAAASALFSLLVACLPEPPPKAVIQVQVRGSVGATGTPEFITDDGYVIRFNKRLLVVAVGTTEDLEGSFYSRGTVRNLDFPPFTGNPARGIGARYLGVVTSSYYTGQVAGPGVTPEDIDMLDGDRVSQYSRTGVAGLVLQGAIEKDDSRWVFDWRTIASGGIACGHGGGEHPAPLSLVSESQHAATLVVHTERLFATNGSQTGIVAAPFIAADKDRNGHITSEELSRVRTSEYYLSASRMFEVFFDGELLACELPNYGLPITRPTPPPDEEDMLPCDGLGDRCRTSSTTDCPDAYRCYSAPTELAGAPVDGGAIDASADGAVFDPLNGVCLPAIGYDRCSAASPCADGVACLLGTGRCLSEREARCACSQYGVGCLTVNVSGSR